MLEFEMLLRSVFGFKEFAQYLFFISQIKFF